jgi:hypothetical protein
MRFATIELIKTPTIETQPVIKATITTASNFEASDANKFAAAVTPLAMYSPIMYTAKPDAMIRNNNNSKPNKEFNLGCFSAKGLLSVFESDFTLCTAHLQCVTMITRYLEKKRE